MNTRANIGHCARSEGAHQRNTVKNVSCWSRAIECATFRALSRTRLAWSFLPASGQRGWVRSISHPRENTGEG